MEDCRRELKELLQEEVSGEKKLVQAGKKTALTHALSQRLAGASLLVLANKQDIGGAMTSAEIAEVRARLSRSRSSGPEPKSDLLLDRLCNSSFSYLTRLTSKPALRAWKESVKVGKAINAFGLDSTGSCRRSRSGSTTEPERF